MKTQAFLMTLSLAGYSVSLASATVELAQQQLADDTYQTHLVGDTSDPVSASVRAHWMRRAILALRETTGSPCPFQAFGSAIVNHTASTPDGLGALICTGANDIASTGNPTLHGEIAGIDNCTTVLSSAPYSLSPAEVSAAWADLTLYTTAEACPMCAAAVGWAGFREYVYATDTTGLTQMGWCQFHLASAEVLERGPSAGKVRIVGGVLAGETDKLFRWQYMDGPCPAGCRRGESGERWCLVHED